MASDPMSFVPEQTVVKLGDQSADDLESQTVDSGLAKSTDLNITELITDSGVAGVSWNAAKKKFVTSEKNTLLLNLRLKQGWILINIIQKLMQVLAQKLQVMQLKFPVENL